MGILRRRAAEPTGYEHCYRHVLDPAVSDCGHCRKPICRFCTIPVSRLAATFCVSCALAAAGVRSRPRLG